METILVADEHELIRRSIRKIIEDFSRQYNFIEARTCTEVIQLLSSGQIQYVIFDPVLADGSIFSVGQTILDYTSLVPMFVFSAKPERIYATQLMRKGMRGYLCKDTSMNELEKAIRIFLLGEIYISAFLRKTLIQATQSEFLVDPIGALSGRELEVAQYMTSGMSTDRIARQLNIDATTAGTYRRRIFKKLDVDNVMELQEKMLVYKLLK